MLLGAIWKLGQRESESLKSMKISQITQDPFTSNEGFYLIETQAGYAEFGQNDVASASNNSSKINSLEICPIFTSTTK